jgi:isopentenyl-diphosphate Delta-isomerase
VEEIILVDENDEMVGTAAKLQAHLEGRLHRAFSVFVFNAQGQLLLQKRSRTKYHSAGLWSNTCCSHPRPGEATDAAARRRLQEEMGFSCELREVFAFVYRAELDVGLIEHEYDHVFVGRFDGEPRPCPGEVEGWRWGDVPSLLADLRDHPAEYTYWLRIAIDRLVALRGARQP